MVNTRGIGDPDAELLSLREIYLIESNAVLTNDLGARGRGFEHLGVKIVLSTEEGVEPISIPYVGEELVLIEGAASFNNFPTRILETPNVITGCIDEAGRRDEN